MNTHQTILLVDDDAEDQLFFAETLSQIKNATLFDVANNGREALNRLENAAILPTLIFMDINMPLMNGVECLTEIIKNQHIKDIPVIILSGSTGEMAIVRALGAKGFIRKTDDSAMMRKQLEQMINLDFVTDGDIANRIFQMAISAS